MQFRQNFTYFFTALTASPDTLYLIKIPFKELFWALGCDSNNLDSLHFAALGPATD